MKVNDLLSRKTIKGTQKGKTFELLNMSLPIVAKREDLMNYTIKSCEAEFLVKYYRILR